MNRKWIAAFASLLCVAVALLLHADPAKTETVTYKSGDENVSGFLALPEGGGKHPAIVVIHEWWGLNDQVKEDTQKLAAQGFVALAVDLYRGKVATTADEAHELMRGVPDDRGIRDLEAAFAYLAARPDVKPGKIGSVGWCMGGGWSIKLAMSEPKLAACAVNYGSLPTEAASIAKIKAPVLGNFGADDRGITPESVRAFDAAMKAAGKPVDVKIYDGAGHAFENPNNKDGYRPQAAADAWSRMEGFFQKTLQ
ncbi:MAG TPA: dienelactone hydrolase family protein [Verrucomicrobiae bacterium]|jgi:carboxymethylenebutenolidase|nr:dienelactone hydrolase family protein [Verrucomicrobiae bacterium]